MDLVTGVTGQDGGYLAELLLATGRRAVGLVIPNEQLPPWVTAAQAAGLGLAACDLADPAAFRQLLRELKPQRVYHCAAMSVQQDAASAAELSSRVNVTSVEVLCDWLWRDAPESRALVVSSSAIFGSAGDPPFSEVSPMQINGEYARQKARVRELAAESRSRGHFCACAIPFNHESPRRPDRFVLPKICRGAARISQGRQQRLELGALSPRRDWGYAPEYAQAMQWMLEVEQPHELVLASGEAHSVQEIAELAFSLAGLDWRNYVDTRGDLLRSDDPDLSIGNPRRAYLELGWEARTRFAELVQLVLAAALTEQPTA